MKIRMVKLQMNDDKPKVILEACDFRMYVAHLLPLLHSLIQHLTFPDRNLVWPYIPHPLKKFIWNQSASSSSFWKKINLFTCWPLQLPWQASNTVHIAFWECKQAIHPSINGTGCQLDLDVCCLHEVYGLAPSGHPIFWCLTSHVSSSNLFIQTSSLCITADKTSGYCLFSFIFSET